MVLVYSKIGESIFQTSSAPKRVLNCFLKKTLGEDDNVIDELLELWDFTQCINKYVLKCTIEYALESTLFTTSNRTFVSNVSFIGTANLIGLHRKLRCSFHRVFCIIKSGLSSLTGV